MQAKAVILIDIDTEQPAKLGPGGTSTDTKIGDDDTVFSRISVGNDVVKNNADIKSALAHELGHVVAQMLHLPASEHMNSLRFSDNLYDRFKMQFDREGFIAEENEAWDIAEEIVRVDKATRDWAVGTYEK